MKKLRFVIVSLIIISCSAQPSPATKAISQDEVVATMVALTTQPNNSDGVDLQTDIPPIATSTTLEIDPGLINVEITIPESFFMGEDMSTFDPNSYADENGFKSAIVNADGSVTIKISKTKYNEIVQESAEALEDSISEIIDTTPYIIAITNDSHFTSVVIEVEKSAYESSFDFTPFLIGLQSMFYQVIAGIDPYCEIIIKDNGTGEILNSVIYPDSL